MSNLIKKKPWVLVPACLKEIQGHLTYTVGKKYLEAVELAGCQPLIVGKTSPQELDQWLDMADGVFLTGSPSNVHPSHYGETVLDDTLPQDAERDSWVLPMIPQLIERGIPLFAICRGLQEANVALGGSLHQEVHTVGPYADHRPPENTSVQEAYAQVHQVHIEPGGLLAGLLKRDEVMVNSLHGQGINSLAPRLRAEARAPDGLVEAISLNQGDGFFLGLQWHPEWRAAENETSIALLNAFGQACRLYRDKHKGPDPASE